MPRGKRAQAERSSAHRYAYKARQFVDEANAAAAAERWDAVVLCAVHAGMSASDAVTTGLAGLRSTDPDHLRAVDLLREVAGGVGETDTKANQLSALLGLKNRIEYEDKLAKELDAVTALDRADRLVAWAEDQVRKARV